MKSKEFSLLFYLGKSFFSLSNGLKFTLKSVQNSQLAILFFLMGVASIFSQDCSYSLSGRLTDLHDDSPIVGAQITIDQEGMISQSDSQGNYTIQQLCLGSITLKISHPNCEPFEKTIILRTNQTFDVSLEHHINELEEIVVSDKSIKALNTTTPEMLLNEKIIEAYSGQSLGEALETISGVSVLKTGSGVIKPMVHGMYGSRIAIVNNAFRLQDQEWGADHAPNIDMNAYENIQLIKGAAALKYAGDTSGGMIVLSASKPLLKDSLYGKTILNATTNGRGKVLITDLTKSYQNGNYFNIQGTLKFFGDRRAPDYILSNTGHREQNIAFKWGKNKIVKGWEVGYSFYSNTIGILRAAHIGNIEDLYRAINSEVPLIIKPYTDTVAAPMQKSSHHNAYFNKYLRFGASSKWNLNYNFQLNNRREFDIRRGIPETTPAIDLELMTQNIATDLEWQKGENNTFNIGLVGQYQDNFANPETGVRRLIPDYTRYQLGAFYTWLYAPNNSFSFDFGARVDFIHLDAKKYYKEDDWEEMQYDLDFGNTIIREVGNQLLVNPVFDYLNKSINSGVSFTISETFTASINYIFSERAPNASELFSDGLHHSLASIEIGDLRLGKETSHKGLLSFTYKNNRSNATLSSYYSRINNYIFSEPTEIKQTIRGAFPVWKYRASDALFWGFDFDFSYKFNESLSFKNSTAYVHATEMDNKTPFIAIPPFNTTQHLTYKDRSHRWEFQISAKSVAEQKRFPNLNFETPIFEDGEYINKIIDISSPPKAYTLLDLTATIYLNKKEKKQDLILRVSSTNLLNVSYRDYLNRLRYYSDELGRDLKLQLIFRY